MYLRSHVTIFGLLASVRASSAALQVAVAESEIISAKKVVGSDL
jgi:hypothetical protein